jgi:hypothetical protein
MTKKPSPASGVPAAAPTTHAQGTRKRTPAQKATTPTAKSPAKPPAAKPRAKASKPPAPEPGSYPPAKPSLESASSEKPRKAPAPVVQLVPKKPKSSSTPPKAPGSAPSQPDLLSLMPKEAHTPGTPLPLKRGRKSTYDRETGELVLARIANGELLNRIGEEDEMPSAAAVRSWVITDVDGFASRYAHARELGWHWHAEEIATLSDRCRVGAKIKTSADGVEIQTADMVERTKLQIDTRKWLLSKMLPKVYGDKLELSGSVELTLAQRLKALNEQAVPPHAPMPPGAEV